MNNTLPSDSNEGRQTTFFISSPVDVAATSSIINTGIIQEDSVTSTSSSSTTVQSSQPSTKRECIGFPSTPEMNFATAIRERALRAENRRLFYQCLNCTVPRCDAKNEGEADKPAPKVVDSDSSSSDSESEDTKIAELSIPWYKRPCKKLNNYSKTNYSNATSPAPKMLIMRKFSPDVTTDSSTDSDSDS